MITKAELIKRLKKIARDEDDDREKNHIQADELLIEYINDKDISKAYDAIDKWYA